MIFDVGRICIKTAGRDANQFAVVVKVLDKNYVLIDGNVRRRKCNISHLEPLDKQLQIKENESTENIHELLKKEGFKIIQKGQPKPKKEKPIKKRKIKKEVIETKKEPKSKKEKPKKSEEKPKK